MNLFNSVKMNRPNKNVFDLSHDVKLSCKMGDLIPICCVPAVPSDKFNIGCESLIRFAPMVSPAMHRMDTTVHYFFVPWRLLWENFEKFVTNTKNPITQEPYVPPFLEVLGDEVSKLADYLGIPTTGDAGETEFLNALPFMAYQLIYKEYYRDQNMVPWDESQVLTDGNNGDLMGWLGQLRRRAWEHDYFTSALPFAQKGDAVNLPIGTVPSTQVMINTDGLGAGDQEAQDPDSFEGNNTSLPYLVRAPLDKVDPSLGDGYLVTNPQDVAPTTINDLRRAFRLQEWLEKNARGGTRYIENILVHFGIKSSDARLQRPEYITGTKSPVTISEVLNTTGTEELPQGNMPGHGISVVGSKNGSYRVEEHGYIMGIMSVMPKTAYQQGISKHMLPFTDPTQLPWPTFANLGEQEILNKELYAFQGPGGADTFGYTPRYAEYKYENNRVAGDFRTSLDFWHLGRIFATPPALNASFINSDPSTRIFAVEDGTDYLYCHVYNKIKAVRPLPKYGTPTF